MGCRHAVRIGEDLDQTGYLEEVYRQVNEIAVKAWKALPNRGAVSGNLTKVLQGPTEPFSDFVAHMVETATKIFGDSDTAMPLIKQLAYEQCTKECRTAITPYKHKGLEIWMKVCRELGGPLTSAGLAAVVVQLGKGTAMDTCFKCGRKGHYRRQCLREMKIEVEKNLDHLGYGHGVKREITGQMSVDLRKIWMAEPYRQDMRCMA